MKSGKVVVLLQGRYAGKKAVIVRQVRRAVTLRAGGDAMGLVAVLWHPRFFLPDLRAAGATWRLTRSSRLPQYDDGHGDRHYGHCVVAGIAKAPLKISKKMDKKKVDNRSKLKAFLKIVNYNHIMPTRYSLSDIANIKDACKSDLLTNEDGDGKKEAAKVVCKELQAK